MNTTKAPQFPPAHPATGSLLGLALGDAMGRPTEFAGISSILASSGPWRQMALPTPAKVTDDTQMTLAVGRALLTAGSGGRPSPIRLERALTTEYVRWYDAPDNNRAPGATCLRACSLLKSGTPWLAATQADSKGCGANMRVAPIGLVPFLGEEEQAGAAQLQSALTHGHPTALAASDLTAHAVRLLSNGANPSLLPHLLRRYARVNRVRYHERWLGALWKRGLGRTPAAFIARGWDEVLAALDRLDAALADPAPEADPCAITGAGWIAEEALATGLLCFLLFPDEPITALRRAACSSGDSDSIACLTGAFAGARHGVTAWPTVWVERIEYRRALLALGAAWDR
ncbi:ADP-ribosylglycohydrolase family protein [Streptomyces sp. NPDC015125]|uniref:ADP-ribosylglycohydrolase family protein n=1 Tax=Streptomyces sp. NPDC015125 TaxID=3364938 RepID=UPI0036FCF80A